MSAAVSATRWGGMRSSGQCSAQVLEGRGVTISQAVREGSKVVRGPSERFGKGRRVQLLVIEGLVLGGAFGPVFNKGGDRLCAGL